MSSALSVDKHVSTVCSSGFFRLHQLCHVRQFVDGESAATLVHAFETSCNDYCNTFFADAPNCLKNFSGCSTLLLVSSAVLRKKSDRGLTSHPLAVPSWSCQLQDRDQCIHDQAPQYKVDCCTPVTSPLDAISDLPGAICSLFNVIGSTLTAVGYSWLLPQQPGIHWQMVCGIQHWVSTPSGDSWS